MYSQTENLSDVRYNMSATLQPQRVQSEWETKSDGFTPAGEEGAERYLYERALQLLRP